MSFFTLKLIVVIISAFKKLGNTISNENPDIVYSNDPTGYQNAIFLKDKYPKVYLILNVLDIPWHFPNIEKQFEFLTKRFFCRADAITSISFKTKKDLSKFFDKNMGDKIQVIYNPIKDVNHDEKIDKNNLFLFVGRANDPIKRIKLVYDSIAKIPEDLKNIKICGSENPGFGNYLGVVPDKDLNKLYNSSKFVLLPSKAEGLGLPMIEGMICGAIPIACSDNLTSKEFLPPDFICEPNSQAITNKIEELDKEYEVKRSLALEFGKKYKTQFNKKNIATNIMNLFNSR